MTFDGALDLKNDLGLEVKNKSPVGLWFLIKYVSEWIRFLRLKRSQKKTNLP